MTENHSYGWTDFVVKIRTDITSLDESFAIQAWCIDHLGNRWATTPPGEDYQDWYFITEADALMFQLRWIK